MQGVNGDITITAVMYFPPIIPAVSVMVDLRSPVARQSLNVS